MIFHKKILDKIKIDYDINTNSYLIKHKKTGKLLISITEEAIEDLMPVKKGDEYFICEEIDGFLEIVDTKIYTEKEAKKENKRREKLRKMVIELIMNKIKNENK